MRVGTRIQRDSGEHFHDVVCGYIGGQEGQWTLLGPLNPHADVALELSLVLEVLLPEDTCPLVFTRLAGRQHRRHLRASVPETGARWCGELANGQPHLVVHFQSNERRAHGRKMNGRQVEFTAVNLNPARPTRLSTAVSGLYIGWMSVATEDHSMQTLVPTAKIETTPVSPSILV